MKRTLFTFVERNDSSKQFENHLQAAVLSKIVGGVNPANATNTEDKSLYCNPWLTCDAWNCAPDCHCKNNLA